MLVIVNKLQRFELSTPWEGIRMVRIYHHFYSDRSRSKGKGSKCVINRTWTCSMLHLELPINIFVFIIGYFPSQPLPSSAEATECQLYLYPSYGLSCPVLAWQRKCYFAAVASAFPSFVVAFVAAALLTAVLSYCLRSVCCYYYCWHCYRL